MLTKLIRTVLKIKKLNCLSHSIFFLQHFRGSSVLLFSASCLFSRLEVSDSPVSAENVIYEDFVLMGGNWVMVHSIGFLEERYCIEKLEMMKNGLVSTFLFHIECNAEKYIRKSP